MNGKIDAFVATASTGGAISGIARRLKENDPNVKIVLADPEGSVYKPYFDGKDDFLSYRKPFKVEGAGKGIIVEAMHFELLDEAVSFNDDSTGIFLISARSKVGYLDRRLCSGAIFPVLFWNCQGGSARIVENILS